MDSSKYQLLSFEERCQLVETWLCLSIHDLKGIDQFFDACEKAIIAKQRTPYWVKANGPAKTVE